MLRSYFSDVPKCAGIYALCAGRGKAMYVAYVGTAKNIKQRIVQHLLRRDSSIVTGTSAVSLNPDKVSEVRWWVNKEFDGFMQEAELVAFEVLQPVLRSRQKKSPPVHYIASKKSFANRMLKIFTSSPSGRIEMPTFHDLLKELSELKQRVRCLEHKVLSENNG